MEITQGFDAGNIEVLSCETADDIRLNIRPDNDSEFYQWFYFRLTGAKQQNCILKIMNAAGAAYPDGFRDYRVCYSYDRLYAFIFHLCDNYTIYLCFLFVSSSVKCYLIK